MTNLAKNLKQLRLAKGYTQSQIADKIGLTRQALSSYESGRTEPDYETLFKLAEIYETDVNAILQDIDSKQKNKAYHTLTISALIILGLWTLLLFIRIILLFIADIVKPDNPDLYMQFYITSSKFDQSAWDLLFYGAVILVLLHLFSSHSVTFRQKFIYVCSYAATSIVLLLISLLLSKQPDLINLFVTLRFNWYMIIAVFVLDDILQRLKKKLKK